MKISALTVSANKQENMFFSRCINNYIIRIYINQPPAKYYFVYNANRY